MALPVEQIVMDWFNTRSDLVGPGRPIERGFYRDLNRTEGTYGFVIKVGTPPDLTAETPVTTARISVTFHAATREGSEVAAVAYTSVIERMKAPTPMFDYRCLVVSNITGPIPINDHDTTKEEFRYLVDADFYLAE